jgi:hypothetical protein
VFHVSQLKTCVSNFVQIPSTLPDPVLVAVYQVPKKILDSRRIKKGETDQVLVQWSNLSRKLATWEEWNPCSSRFQERLFGLNQDLKAGGGGVSRADHSGMADGAKRTRWPAPRLLGRGGLIELGQNDL